MEGKSPSDRFPLLRNCLEETGIPIDGELHGSIPKWLKGNLIRVGPGLLKIGPDQYNHLFDGMALMHKFSFGDGKVQYQSTFLRSDDYKLNMKHNRAVAGQFGTKGVPDPCKTIFQRIASYFQPREGIDNDLVTIVPYSDEVYACSESNLIWRIDPNTLESLNKVNLTHHLPITVALAHAHEDTDGTVYNVGSVFGYDSSYNVLKFPPKDNPSDSPFKNASILGKIPSFKPLTASYHHSFGMTENYFIFIEQPMHIAIRRLGISQYIGGTFADALSWDKNEPCRIHVMKRSDGKLLETRYQAKAFFVFHHINAYEDRDHLVVDLCAYDKGEVIQSLYIKALEAFYTNPKEKESPFKAKAQRFVLPLCADQEVTNDKNLVTLENSNATAYRQGDGVILLNSELLTGPDPWPMEMPRINYEKYNGKKYRYFYSCANKQTLNWTHLIKVDVVDRKTISWSEENVIPSEPVFIPDPESTDATEDAGVLIASLLYNEDQTKVSLLVLNAKTMQEIGRVNFSTKSSVPGDFHGTFITRQ